MAVLATRHVKDVEAANELGKLLARSGEWKQHVPGFIGAAAYISADGREFMNYPRWVDAAAYEAVSWIRFDGMRYRRDIALALQTGRTGP